MKALLKGVLFLAVYFAMTGCTGTKVMTTPDAASMPARYVQQFATVGIKDVPSDRVYPPAGRVTDFFVRELELSGIAGKVYYPMRPDDQLDLVLESKFDVVFDPHMGPSMAKAFITGLTLFILEPLFWYDYDYDLRATVDLVKEGKRTRTIMAGSTASMKMKWLSLGQAQTLEAEALTGAKQSVSRQIIRELSTEK